MGLDNYNGYANWETWNAALWIDNDEGLYSLAREAGSWAAFKDTMADLAEACAVCNEPAGITKGTPDGVTWDNPRIDEREMNECIRELAS